MTRSKYRNVKTVVDGVTFASKAEARRYAELKLLERAGEISHLVLQPKFDLIANDRKCGVYTGDFAYFAGPDRVVEDVKSRATKTEAYRLRKRIVEAIYNIKIVEVA